jgi:5-(carboxyamino)imidazole ribonucleotide mutase
MIALLAQADEALGVLSHAEAALDRFGIAWATSVVHDVERVVPQLHDQGVDVFIVASMSRDPLSAHVAGLTTRPVLAVPVPTADLPPLEVLQATAGADQTPVATFAIGKAGAINAALYAIAILANVHADLRAKLQAFREEQTQKVLQDRLD